MKYKKVKNDLDHYINNAKYLLINNKKYYYESLPKLENIKIQYPIILGKFDPLLISYYNKEWVLNGNEKSIIWKASGQVEGIILFSTGLKATWHYKLKGNKIFFEVNEINSFTEVEKNKLEKKFIKLGKDVFERKIIIKFKEENYE